MSPTPTSTARKARPGTEAVRVICISDTHGRHRGLTLPDGDLLIHAGDFSTHGTLSELSDFMRWFAALPHPHKLLIAGNHDTLLERNPHLARSLIPQGITYLEDSGARLCGLTIWGSPHTPRSFRQAFMPEAQDLRRFRRQIPSGPDVLITHGPPRGVLDRIPRGPALGCELLRDELPRVRPGLHVFGHIHEQAGTERVGETLHVNAAVVDENNDLARGAVVVDRGPDGTWKAAQQTTGEEPT